MGFNSLFVCGKKFNLFMVIFSFLIIYQLIGIYNVQSNEYYSDFYMSNIGNPANSTTPSFYPLQDCSIFAHSRANFSDSSYSATISYYSPFETLISSGTRDLTGNQTCISMGEIEIENDFNGNYEINSKIVHGATTGANFLQSKLYCDISGDYVNFTSDTSQRDSLNNLVNAYYTDEIAPFGDINLSGKLNISNYGFCKQMEVYTFSGASFTLANQYDMAFYYPFNSSVNGLFTYDLDSNSTLTGGSFSLIGAAWYLYKTSDSTSLTVLCAVDECSGSISLDENTEYILMIYRRVNIAVPTTYVVPPDVNFSLNIYLPEWDCSEWSECIGGSQFRNCVDPLGKVIDKIEYQSCYSIPDRTINIGFENSTEVNVFYSYPQWWVFACPLFINYKSVEYPNDWELNNITNPIINNNASLPIISGYIADNLMMSTKYSIEGVKSLKLWYLPPQLYLPDCKYGIIPIENRTCELTPEGNYTTGQFPALYKPINETYLLSRNISFEYPNMTLTAYIKKCSQPVQEWDGDIITWGENYSLITCGDGYYTTDKSKDWDISTTNLFFQVYNYNTSQTLMNVRFVADTENWKQVQIRLLNMTTTDLFRFNLGVSSESPVDSNVYCAYIDNIELNAYTGIVPCESYCDYDTKTYYRAIQVSDYGCSYQVEEVSPLCSSPKQEPLIESCQSFCECDSDKNDYLTYYLADNSSGECNWIIQPELDYCNEYCETEEIKTAPDIIKDELERRGIGFLANFFTAMFAIIMIVIGIAFAITHYLSKGKENVSWQIFMAVLIIQLLIVSILWVEFAFIGIIIVVILALFLAKTYSSE